MRLWLTGRKLLRPARNKAKKVGVKVEKEVRIETFLTLTLTSGWGRISIFLLAWKHNSILQLAARQIAAKFSLYLDFRRASKSFVALPCNHSCAAKHNLSRFSGMLLCLPGLRRLDNFIKTLKPTRLPRLLYLDNFIITNQTQPVYWDFAILTTSS